MANPAKKNDKVDDAIAAVTAPAASAKSASAVTEKPRDDAPPAPMARTLERPASATPPVVQTAAAPAAAPRVMQKLPLPRIQLQGYLHNAWDVTAPRSTILADLLEPDFWTHVAAQLKPHDQVNVICEDGTWYARLFVVNADRLWAKMFKLEYHDLTRSYENMPKTMEEEYEVRWSTLGKYEIIKKSQHGQPALKDGFQTKLEAYQWLDGHLKSLNK